MLYQTLALIGLFSINTEAGCSDLTCSSSTCRAECLSTEGCEWDSSGTNSWDMSCSESDAYNSPECCISDTLSPSSSPTTASPTPETCPSSTSTDCDSIATSRCCTLTTACYWLPSSVNSICATSDASGYDCCRLITPDPTPQPTPKPTTPSPTPQPTTTTTTTTSRSYPTPKPTLPSAEKWEMIHPAYTGNHGELLWQVYYGDFSNDVRFDQFRKEGRWDVQEITPLIVNDRKFRKYTSNRENFNAQSTVVSDGSSVHSYGILIGVAVVILMVLFAVWLRRSKGKQGYEPLKDSPLREGTVEMYSQ